MKRTKGGLMRLKKNVKIFIMHIYTCLHTVYGQMDGGLGKVGCLVSKVVVICRDSKCEL